MINFDLIYLENSLLPAKKGVSYLLYSGSDTLHIFVKFQ